MWRQLTGSLEGKRVFVCRPRPRHMTGLCNLSIRATHSLSCSEALALLRGFSSCFRRPDEWLNIMHEDVLNEYRV